VYAVLYQLSYAPVTLLAGMLVALVAPIVFHRAGDAGDEIRLKEASRLTARVLVVVLATTVVIFAVSLAAHDWLFRQFVAREYTRVSYLSPWLILSGGIFASGQILALDRMSRLETKSLISPKVITAVAGGLLNILGAYLYGLKGLVAASLAFSVFYFCWLLVLTVPLYGVKRPTQLG
jgi:O-antigen/teichoic acid export membrane protein